MICLTLNLAKPFCRQWWKETRPFIRARHRCRHQSATTSLLSLNSAKIKNRAWTWPTALYLASRWSSRMPRLVTTAYATKPRKRKPRSYICSPTRATSRGTSSASTTTARASSQIARAAATGASQVSRSIPTHSTNPFQAPCSRLSRSRLSTDFFERKVSPQNSLHSPTTKCRPLPWLARAAPSLSALPRWRTTTEWWPQQPLSLTRTRVSWAARTDTVTPQCRLTFKQQPIVAVSRQTIGLRQSERTQTVYRPQLATVLRLKQRDTDWYERRGEINWWFW